MALSAVQIQGKFSFGNRWLVVAEITFDSTYPAGGEAYTPGTFGLKTVDAVMVGNSPQGLVVQHDRANKKFKLAHAGTHTHVENTAGAYTQNATTAANTAETMDENAIVDQSATKAEVWVIGR